MPLRESVFSSKQTPTIDFRIPPVIDGVVVVNQILRQIELLLLACRCGGESAIGSLIRGYRRFGGNYGFGTPVVSYAPLPMFNAWVFSFPVLDSPFLPYYVMSSLLLVAHHLCSCLKMVDRKSGLEGRLRLVAIAGTLLAVALCEVAVHPVLLVVAFLLRR